MSSMDLWMQKKKKLRQVFNSVLELFERQTVNLQERQEIKTRLCHFFMNMNYCPQLSNYDKTLEPELRLYAKKEHFHRTTGKERRRRSICLNCRGVVPICVDS